MKKIILSLMFFLSSQSFAEAFNPEFTAQQLAEYINNSGSVLNMYNSFEHFMLKVESDAIKGRISKVSEKLESTRLKAKAVGSKVFIEGIENSYEVTKDKHISYNGIKFDRKNQPYDLFYEKSLQRLNPKPTVMSAFVPTAYAATLGINAAEILLAPVVLGDFILRQIGPVVASGLGITALVGVAANEAWEYYKQAEISCDKDKFIIRVKDRNFLKLATNYKKEIPVQAVRNLSDREDGYAEKCTPEIAKRLNERFSKEVRMTMVDKNAADPKSNADKITK